MRKVHETPRPCAPVVLFVYNRLDHARRTVESLRANELAEQSDLVVYSDAARLETQAHDVQEVRKYIRQLTGFKSVTIVEREMNFGLARSIIDGVTAVVNKYGRIIVLEDDMVTSPYFLRYMNDALDRYADDDRVISAHGYVYPVGQPLPEAFFLPGADCWGWATWQRGWNIFNSDGQYLLDELRRRHLVSAFDFEGAFLFSRMLEDQIKGRNDSWAVRWYASAFLADKLTLYPGRSLVHNIGNDNSGTHCAKTENYTSELSDIPVNLDNVTVEISYEGRKAFEEYFLRTRPGLVRRLAHHARSLLRVGQ